MLSRLVVALSYSSDGEVVYSLLCCTLFCSIGGNEVGLALEECYVVSISVSDYRLVVSRGLTSDIALRDDRIRAAAELYNYITFNACR